MKKSLVGIIVILLVAGGAWFVLSPSSSHPEQLLDHVSDAMESVETVSFEGEVEITGKTTQPLPNPVGFIPPALGGETGAMLSNTETEGTVVLKLSGSMKDLQEDDKFGWLNLDLSLNSNQGDGHIGLAMRMVNEMERYMQITAFDLPEQMSSPELSLVVGQLTNQWIQIEPSEDEDEAESDESEEEEEDFDDVFTHLFEIAVGDKKEDIHGAEAQQIMIVPQIENIRAFALEEYKKDHDGEEMPGDEREKLEKGLVMAQDLTGEIWIGTGKAYVHRFSLSGPFELEDGSSGTIHVKIDLFDYNKPVDVVAPEQVMSMEQLMQKVFSAMLGGSMMGDVDTMPMMISPEMSY